MYFYVNLKKILRLRLFKNHLKSNTSVKLGEPNPLKKEQDMFLYYYLLYILLGWFIKGFFLFTFSLMHCKNHTHGMPRGDFNIYFASRGRGYVRAEEYVYLFYFSHLRSMPFVP